MNSPNLCHSRKGFTRGGKKNHNKKKPKPPPLVPLLNFLKEALRVLLICHLTGPMKNVLPVLWNREPWKISVNHS